MENVEGNALFNFSFCSSALYLRQTLVKKRHSYTGGSRESTHNSKRKTSLTRRTENRYLYDPKKKKIKKIRDTKGIFHAKMGSIKDRNGMDLTEAEDIKKRWQEYTEELYKKDLHDPENHNGVITHLEPDILEYEVKWA